MDINNQATKNVKTKGRRPPFWQVVMRCTVVAGIIDIAFFFLFYSLDSPILAWVNVGSVVMYSFAYYAVKNRQLKPAVILIWTEVLLHAALGIILIGWESGFHYYLLMFIPAICLSASRKPAFISLILLFVFYIGLDSITWFFEPVQPINPVALNIVHLFNLSVVFVLFSYLSFFYLNIVRRTQKKLNTLATTDPLTSLLNRRHITFLADKEIQRLNEIDYSISVLLIDIDYFKDINDKFGHKVGYEVLISVAEILKNEIRKQDLVARWGGEEFSIILPESSADEAKLSAERLRKAFVAFNWHHALGENLSLTISVGVSEFNNTETLSSAIARADRALYRGKAGGRNRVEFDLV
jgi:diguanylate cyclase (GGDEF)-like protein